jgi:hypothetical protein
MTIRGIRTCHRVCSPNSSAIGRPSCSGPESLLKTDEATSATPMPYWPCAADVNTMATSAALRPQNSNGTRTKRGRNQLGATPSAPRSERAELIVARAGRVASNPLGVRAESAGLEEPTVSELVVTTDAACRVAERSTPPVTVCAQWQPPRSARTKRVPMRRQRRRFAGRRRGWRSRSCRQCGGADRQASVRCRAT